jgi:NADH-quinone oxidoreductase subunit G
MDGQMPEKNPISLTIDGQAVAVPAGTNVVDAAHQLAIEVPIFCHHPRLQPVGMCRMCLVDVGTPVLNRDTKEVERDEQGQPVIRFFPKLVTGCTTPVSEGMVVRTATEPVAAARRAVLELLLTSHPLDCPVCDKGGECPLQNLTMRYGPGRSRFDWADKYRFPKPVPIGPLIVLDRERCVQCARCIRFEDEIAGDQVLGFDNRGRGMEIVSFSDPPFRSHFAGNTTDICPVGALTTKDFRFEARAWEVVGRPGVCVHCAVGCNLAYDVRFGHIERVMPRQNDEVNEIWLCDKGRFAHHYAAAPDRLTTPLVRRDGELVPATWGEALGVVAERLKAIKAEHGPTAIGGIAGGSVPNEDLYLFGRFLRATIGTNNVDHRPSVVRDDTIARFGAGIGTRLAGLGEGAVVVVMGLDVEEEAPVLFLSLFKALRSGAKVVVLGGRPQKLEAHATAVLRYRYGGEDGLLAALCQRVLAAEPPATSAAAQSLRAVVVDYTPAWLEGAVTASAAELDAAARAIAEAEDLLVVYGREAVAAGVVPALAALATATGHVGRPDNGLVAVGPHANSQGAADLGLLPAWLPGYRPVSDEAARAALEAVWQAPLPEAKGLGGEAMLAGQVRALLLLGTDPAGDDPRHAAALEGLDFLVVQELFLTETARRAHVVLPAQSPPERAGSFTNMLRRVQRFDAAANPVGEALPGWAILRDLELRFGVAMPFGTAADVMAAIAQAVPAYAGLTYEALGPPPPPPPATLILPFAPITDARQVSYEGTAYRNLYGPGVSWPAGDGTGEPPTWQPQRRMPPDGLVAVPVARLMDAGTLAGRSPILWPLVPRPFVVMSPPDARALDATAGERVHVTSEHGRLTACLVVSDEAPGGVVLVPEGLAWERPVGTLFGGQATVRVTVETVDEVGDGSV